MLNESRRDALMHKAAQMFAEHGFADTKIRDIAKAVGMLPGSIYYHFDSKEELLLEVYKTGAHRLHTALDKALCDAPADPWLRMRRACSSHLAVMADRDDCAPRLVAPDPSDFPPALRETLTVIRDSYIAKLEALIAALEIDPKLDRWLFRAALFGSLNWAQTWIHHRSYSAAQVANAFIDMLRYDITNMPS